MDALRIRGLVKRYGDVAAVDGLDLDVPEGSFFGLLGPNGAGKTTTINMVTGLARPDAGTVHVLGRDAWRESPEARRLIGVSPQEFNCDDFLGLERILAYHAGYFGIDYDDALGRARELLRFFDLHAYRDKRTSTLSGGMKRRLLLARAMMHEPRILVLDEPTAGVDVDLRRSLWAYVRRLNEEEDITVLLTTHYLEEAEALCDDVAVIDHGRVIERGDPDDLRARYGVKRVVVTPAGPVGNVSDLGFRAEEGRLVLEAADPAQALRTLLRRMDQKDVEVEDLEITPSRLEDVFLALTKPGARP